MTEQDVLEMFHEVGAILTGHFIGTSGKHLEQYVNKDAVYPYTEKVSHLCRAVAEHFIDNGAEVVIAPATGGVILSHLVARHLSEMCGRDVLSVYADKVDDDTFVIKRGYDKLVAGKKVLVVDDSTTTGGSVKKVTEAVRAAGGSVVGLGVLCNRGGITKEAAGNVPKLVALLNLNFPTHDAAECPLCKAGVPINTDVGKG